MIAQMMKYAPFTANNRDSIGGRPLLPDDVLWPVCECGARMVCFLQLDIRPEFGLPFQPQSHLTVFMCPLHNDAPETFPQSRLPDAYWERRRRCDGQIRFYEMALYKPGPKEVRHAEDAILAPKGLVFAPAQDDGAQGLQGLKVGGQPSWAQYPESHLCSCGSPMRFLCQIPENWPFAKKPGAPEQPDSFSNDDYCLMLGNEVYIFACEAQCNAHALHAIAQN